MTTPESPFAEDVPGLNSRNLGVAGEVVHRNVMKSKIPEAALHQAALILTGPCTRAARQSLHALAGQCGSNYKCSCGPLPTPTDCHRRLLELQPTTFPLHPKCHLTREKTLAIAAEPDPISFFEPLSDVGWGRFKVDLRRAFGQ